MTHQHYVNLPEAATLATPDLQHVERDLLDIIDNQAMGVVHGAAGTGKTFAVDVALQRYRHSLLRTPSTEPRNPGHNLLGGRTVTWPAERLAPKIVYVVFPHAPTMLRVARDLATALLPWMPVRRRTSRFDLQDIVLEELTILPTLLIVDEAQRLTRHAMEVLRFFYDNRDTHLSLLLVGGDGCWQVISREPMLRSRVYRHRHITPLPARDVPAMMAAYHPLYHHTDPNLLADVDAEFAHGNWRAWAKFTATAYHLARRADRATLDPDLVANTYTSIGDDPDP